LAAKPSLQHSLVMDQVFAQGTALRLQPSNDVLLYAQSASAPAVRSPFRAPKQPPPAASAPAAATRRPPAAIGNPAGVDAAAWSTLQRGRPAAARRLPLSREAAPQKTRWDTREPQRATRRQQAEASRVSRQKAAPERAARRRLPVCKGSGAQGAGRIARQDDVVADQLEIIRMCQAP